MSIIYEKITNKTLEVTIESLKANLKEHEFGVLWQLNFKDKLEEKGIEFKEDYVVLEVCNPKQAKEILDINTHAGYVLPCKMVVRSENNKIYVGLTSPETLLGLFNTPELETIAKDIENTLKNVIESTI
jgi:uncharacterized protein (DUF302 family)